MEINNKKNHLSRIRFSFIMLLFAIGLTMNVLLCSTYNLYDLFNQPTAVETWAVSESTDTNGDGDHTTYFKTSANETITKNLSSIFMIAAVPKGISLLLFLIIVLLFYFLTIFILMPDEWTLMNQKVRLDN